MSEDIIIAKAIKSALPETSMTFIDFPGRTGTIFNSSIKRIEYVYNYDVDGFSWLIILKEGCGGIHRHEKKSKTS